VRREIGTPDGETCSAGQSWQWEGVRFEVLHPGAVARDGNNSSCVLRIDGAFSVLLPGDIEAGAEEHLVASRRGALRADVLLAPHHGSRTSSTPAFAAAVRPRVVVHAAGWRHHFRHPRAEVTARYGALGARQYVTGNGGAIAVWRESPSEPIVAQEFRREAAKFWNAAAGQ
jgi:competence protein ComEC